MASYIRLSDGDACHRSSLHTHWHSFVSGATREQELQLGTFARHVGHHAAESPHGEMQQLVAEETESRQQ